MVYIIKNTCIVISLFCLLLVFGADGFYGMDIEIGVGIITMTAEVSKHVKVTIHLIYQL